MLRDEATFTIAYNGPALADGTMDVRELAPALMALGDLVSEANKIINDESSKIQVRIKADFQVGSFEISIEIIRTVLDQLSGMFSSDHFDAKAILTVIGLIPGLSGINALEVFRIIKGRKIESAERFEDDKVKIYYQDNSQPTIINQPVYNVFVNLNVQDSIQDLLKPLKTEGIDEFYTVEGNAKTNHIKKEDLQYYETPLYEEDKESTITEYSHEGLYKVITSHFEGHYKWRITDGSDKITASMKDEDFLGKISRNEVSIAKEDIFVFRINTKQWIGADGEPKTENEIVKVISHKKRPTQTEIPFKFTE